MSTINPARPRLRERANETPTLSPLMTEDEVADILGTSPRMVRRLRVEGKLPAVRVGRHVRFRPADVAGFIDASTGGAS